MNIRCRLIDENLNDKSIAINMGYLSEKLQFVFDSGCADTLRNYRSIDSARMVMNNVWWTPRVSVAAPDTY